MQTCPECGNSDVRIRVIDGAPVHECGLCGARSGERRAIETLTAADEAKERGFEAAIWPLVRVLDHLPGLLVRSAAPGEAAPPTLPFVELGAASAQSLIQLENVAKSLLLAAGALHCHWVLEVEFQRHLAFVLKPRHSGGQVTASQVREANLDVEGLARQLESYQRLRWWRHADGAPNG